MKRASDMSDGHKSKRRNEFEHSPLLALYEVTRACDDGCRACHRPPQPQRSEAELSTDLGKALIDQLTGFPKPPMLVLTGGDPFKRDDLPELITHAHQKGLKVSLAPSATPQVQREELAELQRRGLTRFCVALDGATAAAHDGFRGTPGSYEQSLRIVRDAVSLGLPVQVNTTLTRDNVDQLEAMADLLAKLDITMWSVSFFIPRGPDTTDLRITAKRIEEVFATLWAHSQYQPYAIKVQNAPHYRRYVQHDLEVHGSDPNPRRTAARYGSEVGTNDGKGLLFISASGQIFPSALLPIECGVFPRDSVVDVYQGSELFKSLRNEDGIAGKCGICQYRGLCGGSRARAYALTGDPLAAEPDCLGGFPDQRSHDPC
jgi:MoaA/NifB/PqqE/SkfB family radical SAM enzyme